MSAQTGPEEWHRLQVFDDGWVEVPSLARAFSDTAAMNRRKLKAALLMLGLLALTMLYANLVLSMDNPPDWLAYGGVVPGLGVIGCMIYLGYLRAVSGTRNREQLRGDRDQMLAMQASGGEVRRAPGAPLFRRARTAQELADWLDGETHVHASDISDVAVSREADLHVVRVRLSDGRAREYRSPEAKLTALLWGLRPGVQPP